MPEINQPRKPQEVTTGWMNYALCEAGICDAGAIRDIKVERLGPQAQGLLSSICRVRISYEAEEPGLPATVVIKFPPESEAAQELGNSYSAFERELMFYRKLAGRSPIRTPKCYFNFMDAENFIYILVLEDVGGWTPATQETGLTINQTRSAVQAISKFHGYWWDSEELEGLKWMPEENRSSVHGFGDNWKDFSAEHREVLSDRDIAAGDLIARSGQKIHDLSRISPRTIIHYDYRADNMMFNENDEILIVDWQMASRLFGAFDVVRAVCGSHHGLLERSHHEEFLNIWYEGLLALGVRDYTIESAWDDYRLGIIYASYIPVGAHHFLSHEGSKGVSLLRAMVERLFYAMHECEVMEILK